jgi:hypothetical protein
MDGIMLRARIVLEPRSITEFSVGQLAAEIASGRTPSSMMKTTGDIEDSFSILSVRASSLKRREGEALSASGSFVAYYTCTCPEGTVQVSFTPGNDGYLYGV